MSTDRDVRPPILAEALLGMILPRGPVRETVLGDLHELFNARVDRPGASPLVARAWYWGTALRLSVGFTLRRLTGAPPHVMNSRAYDGASARWTARAAVPDVRITVRTLFRHLDFSVPAFLLLFLGMTVVTTVFAMVDGIVFRPLDLPEPDRLVVVCEGHRDLADYCIASPANVEDLAASGAVTELGIARGWAFRLTDESGSRGVRGGLATAAFFRALGAAPAAGRYFLPEEVGPDRDKVVVLAHPLWVSRYGADVGAIGRTLDLDGTPHRIVGVLSERARVPLANLESVELWKPPHFDPTDAEVRGWRGFTALGRLAPGVGRSVAEEELSGIYRGLAAAYPADIDENWRLRVESLHDRVLGASARVLLMFLAGSCLLGLIVCAQVANLFLTRGLMRRQEIAIRSALGSGRSRVVAALVVEGLVLTFAAAGVAVPATFLATRLLVRLAPPELPRLGQVAVDARVFAFAVLTALVVTTLFAVLPALRLTRASSGRAIVAGARAGSSGSTERWRTSFMAGGLAFSTILLASAALLFRSFAGYLAWHPPFERDDVLVASAFIDTGVHPSRDDVAALLRRSEEALASVPGVLAASTASAGPLFGGGDGATPFETSGAGADGSEGSAWWFDVGPDYFSTLGIPVVSGRELAESDGRDSEPVALVNRELTRRAWGGDAAVGAILRLPDLGRTVRVIGVVADVEPLTPGASTRPEVYLSNRQAPRWGTYFVVRADGGSVSVAAALEGALEAVDPTLTVGAPRTLRSIERTALVRPHFLASVGLGLALSALALAVLGVYGMVSYVISERARETAIRVALGATPGQVVRRVLGRTAAVAAAGVGTGLITALWVGGRIAEVAPGSADGSTWVVLAAATILFVLAAAAAWFPARRAARHDPIGVITAR